MIDYTYKDLFNQDSVNKQYIIEYDGGRITNKDLYQESIEIKESLCSENELKFGSCEASSITFKVANIVDSLEDKNINVSMYIDGHSEEPLAIGKYKVYSDVPSADRNYRNVKAYDVLYEAINKNVISWYDSIAFPITLKNFRNSLFNYLGITQEITNLPNDSMSIEKTIDADELSGQKVISAICEINGCFGKIGRDSKFKYLFLERKAEGLFPDNDIFPSNDLFPTDKKSETINKWYYINCEYEDFLTKKIDKLQIRNENGDIGYVYGAGNNAYIIQDNFLVYGKIQSDLATISKNIYSAIRDIIYRPFVASVKGSPCRETGDPIRIYTNKGVVIDTYIFERTLSGIQSLRDSYSAKGKPEYSENVNSVNNSIRQLKGKTNVLERSVEETKSTITDVQGNLQSQITQNAKSISSKVSKGTVSSEISQEAGTITISSNRLIIDSTQFKLTSDGKIIIDLKNFKVTKEGDVTAKNLNLEGGSIVIREVPSSENFFEVTSKGEVKMGSSLTFEVNSFVDGYDKKAIKFAIEDRYGNVKDGTTITANEIDTLSFKCRTMETEYQIKSPSIQATTGITSPYFTASSGITTAALTNNGTTTCSGDVNISNGDIYISDSWYNGWSITDCLKDLYSKIGN